MKNKISLRHGDYTFVPVKRVEGTKIETKGNTFIFGEGEATGHMHTLHVPHMDDMEWYKQADGSYIVTLKKDGYATHPEHSMRTDMIVPAGTYKVYQRREKDWFSLSTRRVID